MCIHHVFPAYQFCNSDPLLTDISSLLVNSISQQRYVRLVAHLLAFCSCTMHLPATRSRTLNMIMTSNNKNRYQNSQLMIPVAQEKC